MVFLAQNTSLYNVQAFDPLADPLVVFLHQPITIQYSLSLINIWVWWVEPMSLIKGNPLLIPTISTLHMQSTGET